MTTQTKISTLWIVVMFNMVYADILSFLNGEFLQGLMEGHIEGITYTVWIPVIAAVILQIPITMIFLSRYLVREKNRPANIVAAVATIVFVVGGGSPEPHYFILAGAEIICLCSIINFAWKWRE